eukprot:CAMPEP_0117480308 /NCGR_PEP_ID=MMETSP0784-20121206/12325_1 /TAXON_ID=39447 /ORGANISM="" /LENGTH=1031 /DNA_ID=CAMNT_0005274745 /DNA_START=81 /DNA_END=3177 /DNA_ORIENTATION=+
MSIPELYEDLVVDFAANFWVELCFLLFFAFGFMIMRVDRLNYALSLHCLHKKTGALDRGDEAHPNFNSEQAKIMEAEVAALRPKAVIAAWEAAALSSPTPVDLLRIATQALVDAEPDALVRKLFDHMSAFPKELAEGAVAAKVLDVIARAGLISQMEELWEKLHHELRIPSGASVCEVLAGGYSSVGNVGRVMEIMDCNDKGRLTPRAFALTVRGFLRCNMVDSAMKYLLAMKEHGFSVPVFVVAHLLRRACENGRCNEVVDVMCTHAIPFTAEAISTVLEDCTKRNDAKLVERMVRLSEEAGLRLTVNSCISLLKVYASTGDVRALVIISDARVNGALMSEGLCVCLLTRCADSKFVRFAEEIVRVVRLQGGLTIAIYSALMKVYAFCSMYNKACDLYESICEDGLEPDGMMYGCLMKFSVECGRTDLSRKLSERAPVLDIHNYMSLIRAAGRDKDVPRAFALLQKVKESGCNVDITAYNCVLDVCVSKEMQSAQALVAVMKEKVTLDIITYNTLMKGYCITDDFDSARRLLDDMEANKFGANDVTYNCFINAVVSAGNLAEAWRVIDRMEKNGVQVDHYTVSIMLKALRRVKKNTDVRRTLALLDRAGLDVCSDEILLNTVLETCIRQQELLRLRGVLEAFTASGMRPSVHTYGTLIRACSTLGLIDHCWDLWAEMTEHRGMDPHDIVLGCMLDALVKNSDVEAAVELLEVWKHKVPLNGVHYCTVIKGFAGTQQAHHAKAMWARMRSEGIMMNTVVYNAIIDVHARAGAMVEVSDFVRAMDEDGCVPDVITYSTIVKGYCMKGDIDSAIKVFRGMQKNNMAHDSIVYNTLLDGCFRHSRLDLADTILADMESCCVKPSNYTLGILVKMYGRSKQLSKAFNVVETLPKLHDFRPNAQVYTCLVGACLMNGEIERACDVFEDMKAQGQVPDGRAYGALVSGCIRHRRMEKAVALVEEAYSVTPWSKDKEIDKSILDQLRQALYMQGLSERLGGRLSMSTERCDDAKKANNGRCDGGSGRVRTMRSHHLRQ